MTVPSDSVALGATGLLTPSLGVGTWAWGERPFWGYGDGYGPGDVVDAFLASVDAGLTLFDTAEVYGHGESEKILGYMVRRHARPVLVASKFALLPGRDGARALPRALAASLKRLGLPKLDLYQLHWPDRSMASLASVMDAMADAVAAGTVRAVGVSNCSADEMREAHAALARRGVPLASNQVRYSVLHRAPEADGVVAACRELGVSLLAYSPLEQGLLAGTYAPGTRPAGPRGDAPAFALANVRAAAPVLALLREIGHAHGGRGPAPVALAWLRAQPGVLPLAGAKTGAQARDNAAALALTLADDEVAAIATASERWRAAP